MTLPETDRRARELPRVAIVTGATGAIGSATARRLSGAGWTVALVGRDADRLRTAAEGLGPSARTFVADATDPGAVDAVFGQIVEGMGPPSGLVHAVGSTLLKPAHVISDAEFDEVLDVNLRSAFYALRAFVRAVPRGSAAAIVFFSTAATRIGLMNHEAISAAKGGVDGLVAAASATYASRAIRVNAIAPGLVRSNLTRRLTDNESSLQASQAMHPLGRIGDPEDIAGLAAFLLTADAAWITGQVIAVDGGLSGIKLPPAAGHHVRSVSR
jgi:NAD(P)-dependent dehydrogenase (short-subunit alcohol dehydrogenase family)